MTISGFGLFVGARFGHPNFGLVLTSLLFTAGLLIWIVFEMRHIDRKYQALLIHMQKNSTESLEALLAPEKEFYRSVSELAGCVSTSGGGRGLLRLFSEAGRSCLVLRLSRRFERFRVPIWPIGMSFEPVILDEAEEEFNQWRVRTAGETRLIMIPFVATLSLSSLLLLTGMSKTDVLIFMLGACLLFFALLGPAWIYNLLRPNPQRRLWVFPGGMMLPAKSLIFRRDSSGLIWDAGTKGSSHFLHLSSESSANMHTCRVTVLEAEFALRAWYSPVQSPSDEMLRSFFGRE